MVRTVVIYLLCFFTVALEPNLLATPALVGYTKRAWETQDGLPDQSVEAFAQTSDGYLWIGTKGGLVQFDGAKFTVYTKENTPALTESGVNSLASGPDGSLWIGTEGGGLIRYWHHAFESFPTSNGSTEVFVRAVYRDSNGTVWVGADQGLFKVIDRRLVRIDGRNHIPRLFVRAIVQDKKGDVWVGGTTLLRFRGESVQEYPLPNDSSLNLITRLSADSKGALWMGMHSGLYLLRSSGAIQKIRNCGPVAALYQVSDGRLWLGTVGRGLSIFQRNASSILLSEQSLPSKTISAVFEDSEGNIWLGTQTGMIRLTKSPVRTVHLPQGADAESETIYLDRDESLWVAASPHLFRIHNGIAQPYRLPAIKDAGVRTVFRDREGTLWVGTDGKGLLRLKENRVLRYSNKRGLVNDFVRVIIQSRNGSLWVGTDGGVSHIVANSITNYGVGNGLAYFSVTSLLEDKGGDLWVGTSLGLSHLHGGRIVKDTTTDALKKEKIWSIHEDTDGALWFGTSNGLYRLQKGHLSHFSIAQGLANDVIYQILEDRYGTLWLSGPTSISRLNRHDLEMVESNPHHRIHLSLYLTSYNMESAELYGGLQPAGCITPNGNVWFPSNKGPIHILATQTISNAAPPVIIHRVLVDGQSIAFDRGIILKPENARLEISYGAMLLRSQEAVRYRYKLEGLESWTEADSRPIAYYTNLAPGKYRFRVQAFELYNPEVFSEVSFEIVQKPHFYRTRWFVGLCFLLCVTLAFIVYRLRMHRVRMRFQIVLEERGRLAREMHDTLIQGCVGVSALLEAAGGVEADETELKNQLVAYATDQIRSTIEEARQAVWNLRNSSGSSASIHALLEKITAQLQKNTEAVIASRIDGELFTLSELALHELEMIIREGVKNAILHGRPQKVDIVMQFSERNLELTIRDNGQGFDPGSKLFGAGKHYGLIGMKERIGRLHGRLNVVSAPGEGTELSIRLSRKNCERKKTVLDL